MQFYSNSHLTIKLILRPSKDLGNFPDMISFNLFALKIPHYGSGAGYNHTVHIGPMRYFTFSSPPTPTLTGLSAHGESIRGRTEGSLRMGMELMDILRVSGDFLKSL